MGGARHEGLLANCATMAWDSPLDPEGTVKAHFISLCEWVFLAIFTIEMLSKIVAYGFLMHKGAYLRDPWCQSLAVCLPFGAQSRKCVPLTLMSVPPPRSARWGVAA